MNDDQAAGTARRLKLKPKAKAPKLPDRAKEEQAPTGTVISTTLQGRHYEWLQAIARLEGRTVTQMLERLVRIAYSQDHSKIRTGGATTLREGGASGDGVSGTHPAQGSE